MTRESVGEFLASKRRAKGLSQGEVARALGLSQPGYSNIERGNVRLSPKYVPVLTRLLDLEDVEIVDRIMGFTTATERSILNDDLLTTKQARRLLLLMYGELTGRDSIAVAGLYGGDSTTDAPSP